MKQEIVDEQGNIISSPSATRRLPRRERRSQLSKRGRRPFLNKEGTKIITTEMQAKGAFGKQKNGVTKLSADQHKWVEPVVEKPKKTRKKKAEE